MTVEVIEFVDYGAQGEYGFFGKVVAKLDVVGMSDDVREREVAEMRRVLGDHVVEVVIERCTGWVA